jgi:16S rRNA (cytidine1402-2'-O)-methyltransferase
MAGQLILVATPIGNLGDLTPRGVETLATAELVCCEDTRRTGRLLHHAGVKAKRMAVCNEHTERDRIGDVLAVLGAGGDVAVVSDAGMPGISDPGERLVRAALDAGYVVSAVPGPVAAIAALVSSGLPTARFVFEGFLPRSGVSRRERLTEIAGERRTTVLYEAPHRIVRTLSDLATECGAERPVVVARELTKLHETVVRGTLGDIDVGEPRGEYVIVLAGAPDDVDDEEVTDEFLAAVLDVELRFGTSVRDAATRVAAEFDVPRRRVYEIAVGRGKRPPEPDA